MSKIHKFVSTIQDQPVQVRKTILLVTSFSVMAVVIIIWVSTLSYSLSSNNQAYTKTDVPTEKPFELLSRVFKDSYATALNGFKSTK